MMNNFEEDYFNKAYGGSYSYRNPPYKWKSFIKEIRKYKRGGHLLDVGCATGLFLKQACLYFQCDGCDVSKYSLTQARNQLPNDIHLYNSKIEEIKGQEIYDVITCFDVIEHIPDLNLVWENIIRLLKTDGLLIMTVPVYDGPLGRIINRLDKDPTHIHRYQRGFWLKQIMRNFSLEYFTGIWRYFFINHFYLNILSHWSRLWTTAILIIAKKY